MRRTTLLLLPLATAADGESAPAVQQCAADNPVPHYCLVADPGDPTWDINDYDALRDADDWCKLACNEPHKARRQLAKAVALVRNENNPNRLYFDPKRGSEHGLYVQLLRPWMREQNAAGTHDWQVVQESRYVPYPHLGLGERQFARIGDRLSAAHPRFAVFITEAESVDLEGLSKTDGLPFAERHGETGHYHVRISDDPVGELVNIDMFCVLGAEWDYGYELLSAADVKAAVEQSLDHLGNDAPPPSGGVECRSQP